MITDRGEKTRQGPPLAPRDIVYIGKAASTLIVQQGNPEVAADIHQAAELERSDVEAMPNDTSGLDVERISAFADQMGADEKLIRYLSEEDFKTVRQKRDGNDQKLTDPEGYYSPSGDLIVVRRNRALEELNGPAITESFAVHEIAHGFQFGAPYRALRTTEGKLFWRRKMVTVSPTRGGFRVAPNREDTTPVQGYMLEEAYAEYERGLYVQEHDLIDAFTSGAVNIELFEDSQLPMHYVYKTLDDDGQPSLTFSEGAPLAMVLELLFGEDLSFLDTMREARKTPLGLRTFIQYLNHKQPGLYARLRNANDKDSSREILTDTVRSIRNTKQ